jgi:hypothetical protein
VEPVVVEMVVFQDLLVKMEQITLVVEQVELNQTELVNLELMEEVV